MVDATVETLAAQTPNAEIGFGFRNFIREWNHLVCDLSKLDSGKQYKIDRRPERVSSNNAIH